MAGIFFDYVIVGASRAGMSCAETIRSIDDTGSILLVSREKVFPYKRTKLSKKLYANYSDGEFLLHEKEWYRENRVELFLEAEAVDLAPEIYTLFLADGRKIGYGKLCLATGALPRDLPGSEGIDIRYLREKLDGERLFEDARTWQRIAVIGSGIQGIELAEQFRRMGKSVDLIGIAPQLMLGKVDLAFSALIEETLREQGVGVLRLREIDSASLTRLADEYDGLAASIGIVPAVGCFAGSVECRRGVVIDTSCRTNLPEVFAAGDVTEPIFPFTSGLWHGAEYQGGIAGRAMADGNPKMGLPPFRMKLDIFDAHFYALWYSPDLENDPGVKSHLLPTTETRRYCRLWERDGQLAAALYAGDPAVGKKIISPLAREGAGFTTILDAISAGY